MHAQDLQTLQNQGLLEIAEMSHGYLELVLKPTHSLWTSVMSVCVCVCCCNAIMSSVSGTEQQTAVDISQASWSFILSTSRFTRRWVNTLKMISEVNFWSVCVCVCLNKSDRKCTCNMLYYCAALFKTDFSLASGKLWCAFFTRLKHTVYDTHAVPMHGRWVAVAEMTQSQSQML